MRRLLPLLVLALVAAGAAACDSSITPFAAKVDGSTISQGSVQSDLDAINANTALRCITGSTAGAGDHTYSASFAASRLNSAIDNRLVADELARRHVVVSSFAVSLSSNEIAGQLTPQQGSSCTATGKEAVASFSPALNNSIIGAQAASDTLAAQLAGQPLTTAGVDTFAKEHPVVAASECVSYIAVKDLATANQLLTDIREGASFATVAKASSLDTATGANGGAFGCAGAGNFPAPINTVTPSLAVGQVSSPAPLSTNGTTYYLLIEVTSRQPSAQVAAEALVAQGGPAESKLLASLQQHADVEVNPAYGKWANVNGTFEVTTNAGPPAKFLGNVSAISPVGS